jgi:cytochrome c peroxidase
LVAQGSDGKGRAGAFRIDPASGRVTPLLVEHGAPFRGIAAALDAQGATYFLREGTLFVQPSGEASSELGAARDFALFGAQLAVLNGAGKVLHKGKDFSRAWDCEACERISLGARLIAVRKGELWELSSESASPKRIGGVDGLLGPVSVSPDGRRLAFAVGAQRDDVYALPLPRNLNVPLGLDKHVPVPADNPLTPEKVALGKQLFFDKRLSRDESTACASCHRPDYAFADNVPLAMGIRGQKGERRTPRLANRAWGKSFFWDGRAKSLEEQVLGPIGNPLEMDLDPTLAAKRAGLSVIEMQQALASYVRTILSGDSRYDRFAAGDKTALNAEELAGLALFRGKANCTSCHLGPNFTDEDFHFTGLGQWNGRGFKTPGLRDVARTPPYMHDGSLATLEEVVRFYNEGGRKHPNLDAEMQPLYLNEVEQRQLVAFLKTLDGRIRDAY